MFGNPVANASIIGVQEPSDLQTLLNGSFIVRVPSDTQVVNPANVTDLLNQKYQGLLAENSTFLYITYDDLLDATHIDPTSGPGIFGQRGTISLSPGGTLISVINAGAGTALSGSAPTEALVTWEIFAVTDADPSSGLLQRTYTELPSTPDYATCQVSFNGGVTFRTVMDSQVNNIDLVDQGTSFIIKLQNVTSDRLYISSWAVIY
jgi:hypothetical protein